MTLNRIVSGLIHVSITLSTRYVKDATHEYAPFEYDAAGCQPK